MDSNTKQQLIAKYMDHLWQNFGGRLLELLNSQAWGVGYSTMDDLGHVQLCANTVIMMLVQMVELVCVKDMFAAGAVVSLQSLSRQLHAAATIGDWDAGFCEALASSVIDKCLPLSMGAGEHKTKTAMLFQIAFHPLVSLLMSAEQTPALKSPSRGKSGLPVYPRNAVVTVTIPALARLLTTLSTALQWSHTKTLQFLASWSIGAFLLITQSDLKTLTDTALRVLKLAQPLCTTTDCSSSAGPGLGPVLGSIGPPSTGTHDMQLNNRLNQLWHLLNGVTSKLHNLSSTSSKLFGQDCTRMSTEYWQQAMPVGKVWKRRSNQDYPTEPNAYVESAVETILEPVTDGVSKLKTAAQISAVTVAVVAMLEAWMTHILKEKIKFSLFGAHQLHLDFNYVRQWISSDMSGLMQGTQQSVLSLDVFKHMEGAVQLLKQQPRRRNKSRRDFKDDCCSEYSTSTNAGSESRRNSLLGNTLFPSSDGAASSSEASGSDILDTGIDDEAYLIPKRDEWLALRVHAGSRWKLPLGCLNPQPHET
ncbi:coiled-coil domain-containing protein 142-like [Glandiceps talaboti]